MSDRVISVAPKVQVLGLLQNMNYTPWFALGEFVDNSITSFVKQIRKNPTDDRFTRLVVDITWDEATNVLTIVDNAAGIENSTDGWTRALELGAKNPDPTVLGVYGYGMKAAAFWWSPRITINSKVAGESVMRTATMDIDDIQRLNLESVPLEELPDSDLNRHGTKITLHGLNSGRSYPTGKTLGKVRSYLASMYRSYLRGDANYVHPKTGEPFLEINIQRSAVVAPNPELLLEPFWSKTTPPPEGSELVYWKKEVNFEIPNHREGDHGAEPFRVFGWAGVLKTMSQDAGLYLMYHGKGLVGVGQGAGQASQDTYKPPKLFGSENGWRSRRLVAELDVSDFNKLNTSDGIKFSESERELFEAELEKELRRTLVYEMANNFRPNSKEDFTEKQIAKLQTTVNQAAYSAAVINPLIDYNAIVDDKSALDSSNSNQRIWADRNVFTSRNQAVRFSVQFGDVEDPWLSVYKNGDHPVIEVNINHPFILKFFTIPKNDPQGLFEVAIGIGLAELEVPELYQMRTILNQRLDKHFSELSDDTQDSGFLDAF